MQLFYYQFVSSNAYNETLNHKNINFPDVLSSIMAYLVYIK